jgi:hypothetical protein
MCSAETSSGMRTPHVLAVVKLFYLVLFKHIPKGIVAQR